ncbi:MAG TPA: coenzyme F420-0:L-glutamate ligase [Thermomicrobiales bacterium]|nr:coenzyme F420-0:L-glutamate ligase [Thermomicrobiales bacterium]
MTNTREEQEHASRRPAGVTILPVDGIPDIVESDDIAAMVGDAISDSIGALLPGDVVVVTHKIISKAEGGLIALSTIEPSVLATQIATDWGKDARQVEVVLRQAKRILRMSRGLIIAETHHGFICANAGVDASNVAADTVVILPVDPDASAERIRRTLMTRCFPDRDAEEHPFGVIVTDSFGRPWRSGIVNVAIGVAGIAPLSDYRGKFDPSGYELRASILAIADELASAAELVMHKLAARPVAVVRGYERPTDGPVGTGKDLIMPEERNLFL